MTAARQERKSCHRRVRLWATLAPVSGFFVIGLLTRAIPVRAATSELVVANRYTGLAIDGFDPVAYFVDAVPKVGVAGLKLRSGGAVWRFHNEGNRAAFAAHPSVYTPRFGGYDPVAVARGNATAGNPILWLIVNQRLYLFYSEDARTAFAANPDTARSGRAELARGAAHAGALTG
jgi:hypothetical protein